MCPTPRTISETLLNKYFFCLSSYSSTFGFYISSLTKHFYFVRNRALAEARQISLEKALTSRSRRSAGGSKDQDLNTISTSRSWYSREGHVKNLMVSPGHKSGHKKRMGDLEPRISIKSGISQAINEDGQSTSEKHSRVYFQGSYHKKNNILEKNFSHWAI